jgi:type II secretory pathway pseudopilin PulG
MKIFAPQSGFTLVETLVAISMLMLVMIGPMTISSSASKSTSFSSEQITAFFLAQEGIELAQKARDDLQLVYFSGTQNNPWSTFSNINGTYASCFSATSLCDLTFNTNNSGTLSVTACSQFGTECVLLRDTTTNNLRSRYTHSSGSNTTPSFTRKISFTKVSSDEVKIISKVTWRTGALRQEQKVEAETRLFNVYGN